MKSENPLTVLKPTECACEICKSMCQRPCWGTPEDIKRLIDAGYGDRLMHDYWCAVPNDTPIICPALKGSEGKFAPFIPSSEEGCTFWKDGLCELHEKGLKPTEGKLAYHEHENGEREPYNLHEAVAQTWMNEEAKELVVSWGTKYFKQPFAQNGED
jgi:hypothetical protein